MENKNTETVATSEFGNWLNDKFNIRSEIELIPQRFQLYRFGLPLAHWGDTHEEIINRMIGWEKHSWRFLRLIGYNIKPEEQRHRVRWIIENI